MENSVRYTLGKGARLKGKVAVQQLFAQGEAFTCFPWRVTYARGNAEEATKALFSVPKKRFKHAVDRNRLKRLMREAYRLNRHLLAENAMGWHVAFVAITDTMPNYDFVEKKMREALAELAEKR